jgi:acetoin utilization deacetylase AcuC-like enzyme
VALTGAKALLEGERGVFSLCRPPGHHAALDMYGGYCFLNNAAIAAQYLRDHGAERVAILDIDFHHGNGTQDIFYARDDVLFCSLHGDPEDAFPHFLGYADEAGSGLGTGYNRNYPMPPGTPFAQWREALADALDRVGEFSPQYVVVSLGVDAFENDPLSFFKLTSPDFLTTGQMIGALDIPTLFVMEGGYDVDEVGVNVVNVLKGFDA